MKRIFAVVVLLVSVDALAAEGADRCVGPENLTIGGVGLGDSPATALSKLGQPARTGSYQGEDDGGLYTGTVLTYPQLEVEVEELRGVERIATTSANTSLPLGLKTGMSRAQVAQLPGLAIDGVDQDTLELPVCDTDLDTFLRLHFARDVLVQVELLRYGP